MFFHALPVEMLPISGAQMRCGGVLANVISRKVKEGTVGGNKEGHVVGEGEQRRGIGHNTKKILKLSEKKNVEFD